MFIEKIKKSLRLKLLVNFLFVSLFPFAILFLYVLFFTQTKIVDKSIIEQYKRIESVSSQIDTQLHSLQKELFFLASLDLMDDILAEDIDKRVTRLLAKKANDLGEKIDLFVVDTQQKIVASSEDSLLNHSFKLPVQLKNNFYIQKGTLLLFTKIYASFNKEKTVGHLILQYDLKNLDTYLIHTQSRHSYITNCADFHLGDRTKLAVSLEKQKADVITKEHVIVYKKLGSFLKNYYLVYAVDKSLALKFMYDFIYFMVYISVFGLLMILLLALRYSKSLVLPIEKLTNATQEIGKSHNYSQTLVVSSMDEIGVLTSSFNAMLHTTSQTLQTLEVENRLRLQRFIQLIELFNSIIQTKDETECIEVAIEEMKTITQKHDLKFLKQKTPEGIDLYVSDFEKNEKIYFGSISLSVEGFSDTNEERFYTSIANMIMLQLDKIRLIHRTTAASNAKSAFISTMSHELRTPLNAIIGASQFLISYENISDEQQDTVANIESSAHYLLNMINEILDIAKIESGKMEVHKTEVNLSEIAQSSYNMLQPLAEDKGLAFEFLQEKEQDFSLFTDMKILQQILINLLSNAIKFTQKGFVKMELHTDAEKLIISISDSGIGIAQEDIALLFHEFSQLENPMQKKYKGTGLGLSLSRKMAHLLDGDVTLHSDGLGQGTTAILTFFCYTTKDNTSEFVNV